MTPAPMDTTTDPRPQRALEDASGRRLRRMRWMGRALALLFLVWFAAILLGALGAGPAGRVPFGRVLRPSAGPPSLRHLPPPRQPAPTDLVPALPAAAVAPPVARGSPTATPKKRAAQGRSSVAPGHVTTSVRGRSSSAPGRLRSSATPARTTSVTTTTVSTTTTHRRARAGVGTR